MNIKLTEKDHLRLLTITQDLIRLDSDSLFGNEEAVGEYLFDFFQNLNLKVEKQVCVPGRNNIIVHIPGRDSSRCVMYSGHMDTVPSGECLQWTTPSLEPTVRDGKLYGRGSCDMKGSIACTLFAIEYMCRFGIVPAHDLLFVYDVDEENTNMGLKKYLETPLPADFIIVGEPTDLEINVGHRGVMAFTVTIYGKSAHAGQAHLGKNAIYAATDIIRAIRELQEGMSENYQEYVGTSAITVTQITGGEKVNVVPDLVKLRIDRRLIFGENRNTCIRELEVILNSVEKETGCKTELEVTTYCPPGKTDPQNEMLKKTGILMECVGLNSEPSGFLASCEAGILQEVYDVPVVILGPGSIGQAHQIDEYISLEQLYKGAELYIFLFSELNFERGNSHV